MRKQVNVRLSETVRRLIEIAAREQGVSQADVVEQAVRHWARRQGLDRPPKKNGSKGEKAP